MNKTGDYAKCADCGHAHHRHDRVVRQSDGRRMHWGCLVGWPRSGAVRSFSGPTACQCERFIEVAR